jgi:large-conductance mechanosensitive channel
MRYLTSIIATVFFVMAGIAFGLQIAFYDFAPPAQFIALLFFLLFTILVWLAESQTVDNRVGLSLYYRLISENVVFPFTAYIIQGIIVVLYFLAWNMPFWGFSASMKLALPKGIFIPLIIEFLLFFCVVALWLGNIKANKRTEERLVQHDVKENQQKMLEEQVALLRSRIDYRDQASVDALRLIEQKVESIPLNLGGGSMLRYQEAVEKISRANQTGDVVSLATLRGIKAVMELIK